jgi:predicted TPR repeat methyltransferase
LTGVDLSPAMVEQARRREIYDELIVGELTAHLAAGTERYDLIASADTLVYFGDLQPVLAAAARALRPAGLLVFTVEKAGPGKPAGQGFFLQHHGRYCHAEDYVRSALADAGLVVRDMVSAILRRELDQPVQGLVVSACKSASNSPVSSHSTK